MLSFFARNSESCLGLKDMIVAGNEWRRSGYLARQEASISWAFAPAATGFEEAVLVEQV